LYFGDDLDSSFQYEETTNDGIIWGIPVASKRGIIICDQADIAADFTGFLGVITEPRIALLDADADSYLAFTHSADDTPQITAGGAASKIGFGVEIQVPVDTTDVSNPPTDAELDAIWTSPATVGAGWWTYLDDDGAGNNFYIITSDGSNWWIFTGAKAS